MAPKLEVRIPRADFPDVRIPDVRTIRTLPFAELLPDGRLDGHERSPDLLGRARLAARDVGEAAGAAMASTRRQAPTNEQALRRVADAASSIVSSAGPRASSLASDISHATDEMDVPAALASTVAALGEVARGVLDELGSGGGRMADAASRRASLVGEAALDGVATLRPTARKRSGMGSRLLLVALAVGLAVPLVLYLRRRREERVQASSPEAGDSLSAAAVGGSLSGSADADVPAGLGSDGPDVLVSPGSGWTIETTQATDEWLDAEPEPSGDAPTS